MSAKRRKATTKSPEERAAERRALLADAVAAIGTSDGFRRWMECRARFHRYSWHNTMLIALQAPEATRVAGFKAWKELDRYVRKGEHGIRIFAPSTRIERDEDGQPVLGDDGKPTRRVTFRLVSVFDVAQTDGEPLPTLDRGDDVSGDPTKLRAALDAVAEAAGISVTTADTGSAGGWFRPSDRSITLDQDATPAEQAATLAHELGHAHDPLIVDDPSAYAAHRGDCEAVAEAVAFITAHAAGLDAIDRASSYVAVWTKGDASRIEALAERIDVAVKPLLEALDKSAAAEAEAVAA